MPSLLSTIEMLHVNVARYLILYLEMIAYQTKSQAVHYAILDACIAKDTATANRILREHLLNAFTSSVAKLNTTQGGKYGTV